MVSGAGSVSTWTASSIQGSQAAPVIRSMWISCPLMYPAPAKVAALMVAAVDLTPSRRMKANIPTMATS